MDKKVLVHLENVSKRYDKIDIIKNVSLDIYEGEFVTLLGASGCGKTTILRMISGLESVTSGKVFIDGVDVTNIDATRREVNTIFQNLALFPKMTTYDNIAFGLRMKKMDEKLIDKKVKSAINLVKLNGFQDRYPSELSGGQQQRVAIARGIIMNPKVLLLDESLCSLDLKLKKTMQVELKKIQKKLGITFIYVTHSQDEALSMSDRIVVINEGVIEQVDTPYQIYRNPSSLFVADFIGDANILEAKVLEIRENCAKVKILDNIDLDIKTDLDVKKGEIIKLVIRPEDVIIHKKTCNNSISGVISNLTYSGDNTKLTIDLTDNLIIKASTTDENMYSEKDIVYLTFDTDYIVLLRK